MATLVTSESENPVDRPLIHRMVEAEDSLKVRKFGSPTALPGVNFDVLIRQLLAR
jgi:hypothetical protein